MSEVVMRAGMRRRVQRVGQQLLMRGCSGGGGGGVR